MFSNNGQSCSKKILSHLIHTMLVTGLVGLPFTSFAQSSVDKAEADETTLLEEVVVTGVRKSLISSIDAKRESSEIKDVISAEDIGQLPDVNIAEALQRVTGIQMARDQDGEGSTLQIRGLSNNNVELNGQVISGSSSNRSINFQDIPSELFSSVEVLKAPPSDSIEGSLGGTINLKTRRPLAQKKNMVFSLTGAAQYAEIADQIDPNINAFVLKKWTDTGAGDFGIIFNLAHRKVTSVTESYGGGDFDDAPAVWVRQNGSQAARNPFLTGQWRYDNTIDVNGDGVSDESDIYYVPNGFGFAENTRESERNALMTTLQWQPSEDVNVFLDVTLTDIDEVSSGSRYSLNMNAVRSFPLLSGENTFTHLADTEGLGPVYYMDSGRLGAITTRMGASPNINDIERDTQQYTLGGDWQITDRFNLSAEASTSEGTSNTVEQGALIMGMDFDGNGQLNANDFAGIVDYDITSSTIPFMTFYESPFRAPNFGVGATQDTLTPIDPTDVNYERLAYFQLNRVANDATNTADAFRLDGTLDFGETGITRLTFGGRYAERSFERTQYQNPNQRGNWPSTLDPDGINPTRMINVQRIRVDVDSNSNPDFADTAAYLASCQQPGGYAGFLGSEGGNMPRTWVTTIGCSDADLTNAFNLYDIREIDPNTGVGYYERTGSRYDVVEETNAGYMRADFDIPVGNMQLFGNFGMRYVKTNTSSSGWLKNSEGQFVIVTFEGNYADWLPSVNANLALNDEMVLRFGYSTTLGRPGLSQISPGLNLFYNDNLPGYDGSGTAGNPYLDPVHSDNFDLSFEWYYADASMLSLAVFQKDIDSTIFLGNEQVPLEVGDELFLVRTFDNFPGTKIKGVETNLVHAFESLPGLLSHTGLILNYTYTSEDSDLVDQEGDAIDRRNLSGSSYNAIAYYDDGRFSLRLAYNWRDKFVRRENVNLGFARPEFLPEYEAARGQLDLSANYTFSSKLKVYFTAVNLNDSKTERYMKHEELVNYVAFAGRRYTLGLTYRLGLN